MDGSLKKHKPYRRIILDPLYLNWLNKDFPQINQAPLVLEFMVP